MYVNAIGEPLEFFVFLIYFIKFSDDFGTWLKFALPALHFGKFEGCVTRYCRIEWNSTVWREVGPQSAWPTSDLKHPEKAGCRYEPFHAVIDRLGSTGMRHCKKVQLGERGKLQFEYEWIWRTGSTMKTIATYNVGI